MPATLTPPHTAALGSTRPFRPSHPTAPGPATGPLTADDVIIGVALTTSWMLLTGRRLHQPPLLHHLPADQLIDFWADDDTHAPPCR